MGMNAAGWTFLIVAWFFILGLVIFCFRKVMSTGDTSFEHPEKTPGPGSAPGA